MSKDEAQLGGASQWYEKPFIVNAIIVAVSILLLLSHIALKHSSPVVIAPEQHSSSATEPTQSDGEGKAAVADAMFELSYREIFSELARDLGIAGFIAFVLNISIETFTRRRHRVQEQNLISQMDNQRTSLLAELEGKRQEMIETINAQHKTSGRELLEAVNKELFAAVYKRNIPHVVFTQVERSLLKCDFYRPVYKARYSIKRLSDITGLDGDSDFVMLNAIHHYEVQNISDTDAQYKIDAVIDISPHADAKRYKISSVMIDKKPINSEVLEKDHIRIDEKRRLLIFECGVQIKKGDSLEVDVEYQQIHRIDASEVICSVLPMASLHLEILIPNEDFEVKATSLHPEPEELVSSPHETNFKAWAIPHGIFPGQGIYISWYPKVAATEGAGGAVPDAIATNGDA